MWTTRPQCIRLLASQAHRFYRRTVRDEATGNEISARGASSKTGFLTDPLFDGCGSQGKLGKGIGFAFVPAPMRSSSGVARRTASQQCEGAPHVEMWKDDRIPGKLAIGTGSAFTFLAVMAVLGILRQIRVSSGPRLSRNEQAATDIAVDDEAPVLSQLNAYPRVARKPHLTFREETERCAARGRTMRPACKHVYVRDKDEELLPSGRNHPAFAPGVGAVAGFLRPGWNHAQCRSFGKNVLRSPSLWE
jgi:hypothetical protein